LKTLVKTIVCEGKTDVHQLRVGVSRDLDRFEFVIADGTAGFRECADEADQRIAPDIASGAHDCLLPMAG
jgi:hypothetical protein